MKNIIELGKQYRLKLQDQSVATLIVHGARPGRVELTFDGIYQEHPDFGFVILLSIEEVEAGVA